MSNYDEAVQRQQFDSLTIVKIWHCGTHYEMHRKDGQIFTVALNDYFGKPFNFIAEVKK